MNRPLPAPAGDIALLVTRLLLGTVMLAHGLMKFSSGLGRTTEGFERMNIPLAIVSASFATVVECVGSVLLIVGAMTPVVCALMLVIMAGAAAFVHIPHGIFVADGGWELVGVISACLVALAATGPGRFSVDSWVRSRQKQYQRDLAAARPATRSTAPAVH